MIEKLEMFIALAREEHFGRAAAACGVAQPSLSAAIKQLEEQLGVMLVWRGSRYQGLTPEGARVLEWARQIVGDARAMRDEMRAVHEGLAGKLRLAVIPTALGLAAELTARFAQAHPNVRFTVLSRTSLEVQAMIDNLEVDAGLTYLSPDAAPRMLQVPLFDERYVLVCAPDGPLADRDTVKWADLDGLPMALLTPDMQNRRFVNDHLAAAGAHVDALVESNSQIMQLARVRAGGCAAIMPQALAQMLALGMGLRVVPIRGGNARHGVGLVAPVRDPQTPVLAALLAEAARLAQHERGQK